MEISIESMRKIVDGQRFQMKELPRYTVFNYGKMTFGKDFNCPEHMECRGIVFDSAGTCIRRPFPKFFNLGEHELSSVEHFDALVKRCGVDNIQAYTKLDGSMICPFIVDDDVIWGTRWGDTDHAAAVKAFVAKNKKYEKFVRDMNKLGISVIFEWLSPQDPHIVDYNGREELVLLGGRDMKTGRDYLPYEFDIQDYGISVPTRSIEFEAAVAKGFANAPALLKDRVNFEGYVVCIIDGATIHRVKIKTEWHAQMRHVRDDMNYLSVLDHTLDGSVDDFLGAAALFSPNHAKTAAEMVYNVCDKFQTAVREILRDYADVAVFKENRKLAYEVASTKKYTAVLMSLDPFGRNDCVDHALTEYLRRNTAARKEFVREFIYF